MKRWCLVHRIGPPALALAAGALFPLGFAPFDYVFVAPLSLGVLFMLWLSAGVLGAALLGFCFGIGLFGVGVSWVYISLHSFGGMPPQLAAFLVVGFILIMSVYPAAAGVIQAAGRRRSPALRMLVLMPACWVLCEWLRGVIFTGFPWLYLGYGMIDTPLAALAPFGGVLAVSWAAAIGGTALVMVVTGPRHDRLAGFAAILASVLLVLVFGRTAWVTSAGQPIRVTVIQNNVPLNEKWSPNAVESIVEEYLVASRDSPASDLLIWPEAALPLYLDEIRDDDLMQLRRLPGDVLLGVLERRLIKDKVVLYNSALGLGERDTLYRKQQLVPFGEYLPLRWLFGWVLNYLQIPMSDFTAWSDKQQPMVLAGQKVAVSICYEDAFSAVIRRSLPAATVLVNLSEDAWFGDSLAPHQRLQMARMRALESARPLIRASNNGLSALISADGRVLKSAPQFQQHGLHGFVEPMTEETPFVRYGSLPVVVFVLLVVVLASAPWTRRRR